MQAGKRYTLLQTLLWGVNYIWIFLLWATIPVGLYFFTQWTWLIIPWQPLSLIGIAVAFYLGFKNNSSYERLWEGRKIWGGIVNASRTFTVMVRDFITNEFTSNPRDEAELLFIHKKIVHRHVAWLYALTIQLRKIQEWEHDSKKDMKHRRDMGVMYEETQFEQLREYLSEKEFEYIMSKGNKASHLLSLQSKALKEMKGEELIDNFRHMELENMIKEFYTLQGKSERIKNFPFPRQYATATYFFIVLFLLLLPFGMLSLFAHPEMNALSDYMVFLAIPFSVICSWVFWTMQMIGDYSENPFEGLYNDVPITALARGIEIDIRQMLEEENLPKPLKPQGTMKLLY